MANEITLTTSIRWARSGIVLQATQTDSITQTGTAAISNVQAIGNTSEAVVFGEVTDPAYIYFKNLDATSKVYIGVVSPVTSVNAAITLEPGKADRVSTTIALWYAISETGTINLEVLAVQR